MHLVQYRDEDGARRVAKVEGDALVPLAGTPSTYDLALAAIAAGRSLEEAVEARAGAKRIPYDAVAGRLLPPLDHPDPAHCLVTGTGLTHLGSADARDKMHQEATKEESVTDSMAMFRMGLEGGRPAPGEAGVQPEWFYKGDGGCLVAPGQPFTMPDFALDGGEEPEIVGLYVIAGDGAPWRLGFALGNEFSDHVMERQNYLYLAHSKLRQASFGPALRTGPMPEDIRGRARIRRDGATLWEKPFLSGEANMSHSLANLEYHHFKYRLFRRPGDVHVHFFGTATLSFADGVRPRPGDVFEISAEDFGRPLVNGLARGAPEPVAVRSL